MSRVKAVLFDMDGVLVDSEPYWQRVWQERVFAAVVDGNPSMDEITGRNYRESLHDLADAYGLSKDVKHFAHQFETAAERIYSEQVSITSNISVLFQDIRNRERALGIVYHFRTVETNQPIPSDAWPKRNNALFPTESELAP